MQYINSNLGIPIKSSFADMMRVNNYSNATGDSASSLQSQIRKIESQLSSLSTKRQKEELKKKTEQEKKQRGALKLTIVGGYKFKQGDREIRQANVAINQAETEIRNIDNQIASLNIDLASLQSQLEAMGGAPTSSSSSSSSSTPKPATPSAPVIDGGVPSAGLVPLPDAGTTPQDSATGTTKKPNWALIAGVGFVSYLALTIFVNKVIKPQ
jgi:prefoldin subunit 5